MSKIYIVLRISLFDHRTPILGIFKDENKADEFALNKNTPRKRNGQKAMVQEHQMVD